MQCGGSPTIYGWRKRCLYALVLGLLVVVLCNLVATLLILNAINFNLGGLGYLAVSSNGMHLRDVSTVLDSLVTSKLSSRHKENLSFEPYYNMTVLLSDPVLPLESQALHFWTSLHEPNRHEVTALTSQFRVSDVRGRELFSAEDGHVSVGTDILRVMGGSTDTRRTGANHNLRTTTVAGSVRFSGSVQTSMVRSTPGEELMLESATRRLFLSGMAEVSIESRAADISVSCLTNLLLFSSHGKIKLKAPGIYIPNLESIPLLQPQHSRYIKLENRMSSSAYQVCMCSNGKLFVSAPNGECSVNNDGTQCR